jgi:hypothetical protein
MTIIRKISMPAMAALISGCISAWAAYSIGWSNGSMQGHTLGVLNCETREMCDKFLPGAKAWWAEQEKKYGATAIGAKED